jgi:hypothetical protein
MATARESMDRLMEIDGAVGCCIVDGNSGMVLAQAGGGPVNLEIAAAGNTEVVRSKLKTIKNLNLRDSIEDILITLEKQYHLIRLIKTSEALFMYLVLDKPKSNLAMARHVLADTEKSLAI